MIIRIFKVGFISPRPLQRCGWWICHGFKILMHARSTADKRKQKLVVTLVCSSQDHVDCSHRAVFACQLFD